MPANTIPKYVQVFKFIEVDEAYKEPGLKEKLIKIYEEGGIQVDQDYLNLNPTAKLKFMYVVSKEPVKTGNTKLKLDGNSDIGYWIYCGKCYVRKVSNEYEFGTYLAYETKTRKITDFWDEEKYKRINAEK